MNVLRIAIVTYSYPVEVGGGGLYATLIAQELAALGEDVHVFASRNLENDSEPNAGQLNFHHVPLFSWPLANASYWMFLMGKIRSVASSTGSFDVLHYMGTSGYRLPKHDKSWKLGVCTMFHLSQVTKEEIQPSLISKIRYFGGEIGLMSKYEKRCINRADCILTTSEYTKREISHRYNKPSPSIGVIPPAISPEILRLSEIPLEELPGQPLHPNRGSNILFVGRVYYRKRIDFLLESFKEVLRNHNVTLWIVGPGNLDFYRKRARKLGIEKEVVFTGTIDRSALVRLYKLCDVFAFPSVNEGFGFVLVEAMINGLPIVAVNRTSIPEVADGCGILVEPDDLKGFAQAISRLLANKKMKQSLGEAGRRKAARDYLDWGFVSRRTRLFYLEQKNLITR